MGNNIDMTTEEVIRLASEAGANAAMKHLDEQRKKERKARRDKRFHNTKLLLKHYKSFKEHIANAVFENPRTEGNVLAEIEELMWTPAVTSDMIVESIKRNFIRTKIIVEHIERMVECYREMCKDNVVAKRRADIIYEKYIAEESYTQSEIAEKHNIDTRTVYKDITAACETLSMLLFGADGIS